MAARWAVGLAMIVVAIHVGSLNWYVLGRQLAGRQAPSRVHLVGGVLGAIGLAILPIEASSFWWLAFFADAGSIPGLSASLVYGIRRRTPPGSGSDEP